MRDAQQISAWQVAALVPGTLVLVLIFTLLVAKPIRQIDSAIHQLGESGLSTPISVKGPTDLERLGRQLEWLRVRLLELAQEKNKFLRQMSHELKTPLASIAGVGESLQRYRMSEDELARVAGLVRGEAARLQEMVSTFLDLERPCAELEVKPRRRVTVEREHLVVGMPAECLMEHASGEQEAIVTLPDLIDRLGLHHEMMEAMYFEYRPVINTEVGGMLHPD